MNGTVSSEKTEWETILENHGIIESSNAIDEPDPFYHVANSKTNPLKTKHVREESDKSDESEEDEELRALEEESGEMLESYRQKRLMELNETLKGNRFGTLVTFPSSEFVKEVTEASKIVPVIVHLFSPSVSVCNQLDALLSQVASKYPKSKFLRSLATDCIPGYPAHNIPTLLIYLKGDLRCQLVGAKQILPHAGATSAMDLANLLMNLGAIEDDREPSDSKGDSDSDWD